MRAGGAERRRGPTWPGRGDQVVAEAGDEVDLGQRVAQLVAVALRHAAGHDEAGAAAPALGQAQDRVDRLLARRLDEGARVDDDEVGGVGVGRWA